MDITPNRDQLVFLEPRADRPLSEQPAIHDLLTMPRRLFLHPVRWVLTIASVVMIFLPGHPFRLALPVSLAVLGLSSIVVAGIVSRFVPSRELTALSADTPRQVTFGDRDLVRSGRVVGIRLESQWVVGRLPESDVMMLARLRRVWVFGPSPGGRIGLFVLGSAWPKVTRLAPAPPAGAQPVPAPAPPAEWPPPVSADPAVRHVLGRRLLAGVVPMALFFAAFSWVAVDLLTVNHAWLLLAFILVMDIGVVLREIRRTTRTIRSGRWTWTRVMIVEPPKQISLRMAMKMRVGVPGQETQLDVAGPAALVLAVYESEQLWFIGDLGSGQQKFVGMPEVPTIGSVQRPRR